MADDNSWRTPSFRQNVVAKINEAIQASGRNPTKSSIEMESHVFQKARTKDEYLGFVARLILHVREMNTKNKNPQGPGDVSNTGSMPDPINALQNLASQGTRNPQMGQMGLGMSTPPGMGGPNGPVVNNAAASNLLQTLTQQRPGQQPQMQQIQNMQTGRGGPMNAQMANSMGGNIPQGNMQMGNQMAMTGMNQGIGGGNINTMAMGNQINPQMANQAGQMNPQINQIPSGQMQMNPNAMNQSQMGAMNSMGQMQMNPGAMNQNQMGNQMAQVGMNQAQMNQMTGGMNIGGPGPGGLNQNVGGIGNQMAQLNPNVINQINTGGGGGAPVLNPQQAQMNQAMNPQKAPGIGQQNPLTQAQMQQGGPINPNQMMNMQHMGRKAQDMLMTNSGNVFQGVRNVTPNPFLRQSPSPQVPSPASMGQGHQSQMVPSPALVPSPSPQIIGGPPRSMNPVMTQSPSSSINTPGQPGAVPSPLNPQEEQLYREKYRQLTKYIEPLKRMIARMVNGENSNTLQKMNKLLEILCNPNQRIPLETLLKCEKALEKMDFKTNVLVTSGSQMSNLKEHQINNPLLEAVSANLQNPLGNHTLQRTFRPCLEALFGPDIKNLPPSAKQIRLSHDESLSTSSVGGLTAGGPEIPHILQGEIARLDQKFKISIDPSAQLGTKAIKLVCCLDDKHLPCVPPVSVSIPDDYPSSAPNCNLTEQEYNATPFLVSVQKALTARISKLPRQFSLSHLLDTWEMSVRQACAPIVINPTQTTVLLGI